MKLTHDLVKYNRSDRSKGYKCYDNWVEFTIQETEKILGQYTKNEVKEIAEENSGLLYNWMPLQLAFPECGYPGQSSQKVDNFLLNFKEVLEG